MSELPVAAVEAAAKAVYQQWQSDRPATNWDNMSDGYREVFYIDARLALAAAVPHLTAQLANEIDTWLFGGDATRSDAMRQAAIDVVRAAGERWAQ